MRRPSLIAALAVPAVLAMAACSSYDDPGTEPAITSSDLPSTSQGSTAAPTSAAASPSEPGDDASSEAPKSAATISPETVVPPASTDLATWEVPVSVEDAVSRASGATDGAMYQIELEYSAFYRSWVYKVSFQQVGSSSVIVINPVTGDIIANERDDDDDDDREPALDPSQMAVSTAIEFAQKVVSGPVDEWQLHWEDDAQVYSIDIRSGDDTEEVIVETMTGRAYVED